MSRLVARAESFERVYDAFSNINFAAFDYDTVKQSLLDYVKLYFPETFNDFIESSEFIAIIETFAYIAELLAYRIDINAHENFMSTAQRKDSILRLAKLISYTAARPLPARGLVKITSVSTTESVVDANGNDLSGRKIYWNDASNPNWKDQFVILMNRVLEQSFGTVGPTDRFQMQDVLFELYSWDLSPLDTGVFSYTASASGQSAPMELVPVEYDVSQGIIERRPQSNKNFTFLYGQDGLGDSSDTTGFFCFTKQGKLQRIRTTFDGVTPNQTYDVPTSDVNDIDVWVNNVDPVTNEIIDAPSPLPYRRDVLSGKSGEWVQVDLAHAQNVIFNTNPKRTKYEIETRDDNKVRLIFGDGEFADVPMGTFDIWVRSSLNKDVVVSQASVTNLPMSFTYVDDYNRTQTFTFTFSLIGSLQNGSAAEDIEHVRTTAPAVYYAQDRMVNAEDYNMFMLQDPSILKLRAVNRTFAGDSKYITWHDASGTYENVKLFGDDGILYYQDKYESDITPSVDINTLISMYIEPLLSSTDILVQISSQPSFNPIFFKRIFTTTEKERIVAALTPPPIPVSTKLYYNNTYYEWYAVKTSDLVNDEPVDLPGWPTQFIPQALITIDQNVLNSKYDIARRARRLVFQSQTTSFWNTNDANRVIEYDTLDSNGDNVVILQANTNSGRTGLLANEWNLDVVGQEVTESGPDLALPDIHRLSTLTADENGDGTPDNMSLSGLLHPDVAVTASNIGVLTNGNPGYLYNGGTFTNVPLRGGSGVNAKATVTVTASSVRAIDQTTINSGTGYTAGYYTNVPMVCVPGYGTGTGAYANIEIKSGIIAGMDIYNLTPGTGYTSPTNYPYKYMGVPATTVTGVGEGALLDIEIHPGRGAITALTNISTTVYRGGPWTNVPIQGGTGYGASVDVTVTPIANIIGIAWGTAGSGYNPGTNIPVTFSGGTGTGASGVMTVVHGGEIAIGTIEGGTGYTVGTYYNVPTFNLSGSGSGATATVSVTETGGEILQIANTWNPGYNVMTPYGPVTLYGPNGAMAQVTLTVTDGAITTTSITNAGTNYTVGVYHQVPLAVDSPGGEWATATITVTGSAVGTASSTMGSAYTDGTHVGIPLVGGSGTGALATFTVVGGMVVDAVFTARGSGYAVSDVLTATLPGDPTPFVATIVTLFGTVTGLTFLYSPNTGNMNTDVPMWDNRGKGYSVGDNLSVGASELGGTGSGFSATILSTSDCVSDIYVSDGGYGFAVNDYCTVDSLSFWANGTAFKVLVTTPVSGTVTGFTITSPGSGYTTNTILSVSNSYLGIGGSGLAATISSVAPYGRVSSWSVTGGGGTGYSINDVLTINTNATTGYGTGFTGYVTNVYRYGPITTLTVNDGGAGYSTSDTPQIWGNTLFDAVSSTFNNGSSNLDVTNIMTGGVTYVSATGTANGGQGYEPGDIITVLPQYIGGTGEGFQTSVYSVTNGVVTSVIPNVYSGGSGYAANNKIRPVNNSYVGGTGSGMEATVTKVQGGILTPPVLTNRGYGYRIGDILTIDLPAICEYTDALGTTTYGDQFSTTVTTTQLGSVLLPIYGILSQGDITVLGGTSTVTSATGDADITNYISLSTPVSATYIHVKDYVYFSRLSLDSPWVPEESTPETMAEYMLDVNRDTDQGLWKRHEGRDGLNFAWFHRTPRYNLVDPSPTNIIDSFIITKGYYTALKRWLENPQATKPAEPTPLDLRTSYNYLLDNRMISDTVILHPGKIKLLFGSKAHSSLRAVFRVVRSENSTLTDNQIKTTMVTVIRNFFDIASWEFGETFYATELFAAIHAALPSEINSVVLVPLLSQNQFGDLFQILAREDEVFYPDITVDNIEVVTGYTATNLRLNG